MKLFFGSLLALSCPASFSQLRFLSCSRTQIRKLTRKKSLDPKTTAKMHLKLQCLNDEARHLYGKHGHYKPGDSGLDLFCVAEEQTIKAGETAFIKLGLKASAWNSEGKNVSFLLFPRSSISKTPLRLANSVGLIDAGYRGELMAAVDNIKTVDHTVKRGDRLVQAVSFSGEPLTFEIARGFP
mmetsp:Transcript_49608/g.97752  ORF Transcript_49608/g.97752 Transcript_49608/m.97752 type:complete len:183 (-) Transcript_49608:441-989(-)